MLNAEIIQAGSYPAFFVYSSTVILSGADPEALMRSIKRRAAESKDPPGPEEKQRDPSTPPRRYIDAKASMYRRGSAQDDSLQ